VRHDGGWRRDEPEFSVRHQQRLAAAESEAVILLGTMNAKTQTLNPGLDVVPIAGHRVSTASAIAAQPKSKAWHSAVPQRLISATEM
jgi:hypothetical protein